MSQNGSGGHANHYKLNKDNSILEIAKMQNSGASTSENVYSVLDKDFL